MFYGNSIRKTIFRSAQKQHWPDKGKPQARPMAYFFRIMTYPTLPSKLI